MQRKAGVITAVALGCGLVAAIVAFSFSRSARHETAPTGEPTGILQQPFETIPPALSPTPTLEPVRRSSSSSHTGMQPVPTKRPESPSLDNFPDGSGLSSARKAMENGPQEPAEPKQP